MDQLRTALAWLQRQHFWVLSVLVALIAIGCWWSASGKISKAFATNQTTIKGEFENVKKVRSDPFHPNEDVNAKQLAQTRQQADDVAKLWQQLYDRQRAHVLEWPVPPLSKEFGDYVEKLQFGAEIPPKLRSNYQDYIEGHFPQLPKQIDARMAEAGATGGPGGGEFSRGRSYAEGPGGTSAGSNELQDENDYVCEWLPADQAFVREDLNFAQRPYSIQIWVTQENLWVYHTLLDVIARTNRAAGATRNSNAAVRNVAELAVGQRAARSSRTPGRLLWKPPEPTSTAGPGERLGPGTPGTSPEAGPGGRGEFNPERPGPGGGQLTEEQEKTVLLNGRYLDAQGKPFPFGGGGAAAAPSDPSTPAPTPEPTAVAGQPLDLTIFGQEYKRLPVRMVLRMDQRWLPYLISTCASESLQIEVQEVHINTPDAGNMAEGGPGGGSIRGIGEGGPGGGSSTYTFPEEPPLQPFPSHPEIVNVVIQGTIYIFNKPNPAILQPPGDQPQAGGGG